MKAYKIMPLGDSITDGFTTEGGYRTTLCALLEKNGYAERVSFCGSQSSGDCYDPRHEGHPGWSTVNIDPADGGSPNSEPRDGITERLGEWLAVKPDVVMLQIGTNDIINDYKLDELPARLERIVDTVLAALPEDGTLFLATIPYMDGTKHQYILPEFNAADMDRRVEEYNRHVRQIAAERERVILAEINSVLTKHDLTDGVHPTPEGYRKMGVFWFNTVKQIINKK